jgi:FKBP-type peptidyl-prolyl cis-trans isomerase
MKQFMVALCALTLFGCREGKKNVSLESQADKVSYSIGLNVGKTLHHESLTINEDAFMRGVNDGLADSAKPLLTDAEVTEVMTAVEQQVMAKRAEAAHAVAEKNKEEGEKFLAENKTKPGVVTLPDGLQYQVLKEGHGKTPNESQTVIANYTGMLLDGTLFDSSEHHGGPATLQIASVIPGWREALTKMKVGSRWKIFVPPSLAYGQHGAGSAIGPNATLVFEIELLGVK